MSLEVQTVLKYSRIFAKTTFGEVCVGAVALRLLFGGDLISTPTKKSWYPYSEKERQEYSYMQTDTCKKLGIEH